MENTKRNNKGEEAAIAIEGATIGRNLTEGETLTLHTNKTIRGHPKYIRIQP